MLTLSYIRNQVATDDKSNIARAPNFKTFFRLQESDAGELVSNGIISILIYSFDLN